MGHIVLPSSSTDPAKAKNLPGYFADTGVTTMLNDMKAKGCAPQSIFAKIAGGAKTSVDIGDYFGIGQRNAVAVKATLLKNGIKVLADDLGGTYSRTVSIRVGDNKLHLLHPDKGNWEI